MLVTEGSNGRRYVSLASVHPHLEHPEFLFQLSDAVSSFIPYFTQTEPIGFGWRIPSTKTDASLFIRRCFPRQETRQRHVKSRRGALCSDGKHVWRKPRPGATRALIGRRGRGSVRFARPGGTDGGNARYEGGDWCGGCWTIVSLQQREQVN